MYEMFKRHTNRYTFGGALVYAVLLNLCYSIGTPGQLVALILGPIVLGGFWLCAKSFERPTVKCVCGGEVTALADHGPCGCSTEPAQTS